VLSPDGQGLLDDTAIGGRTHRVLDTPTPVARFIAAVNALTTGEAMRTAA
jgi:hypothetical protein